MTQETWSVEAGASLQSILDRPDTPPLLRQVLTGPHSWQMRNETPISRALRASRLAPEWVAALLVLDARVVLEGDDGPVELSLEALLEGSSQGEIVTLRVPLAAGERLQWGTARVARTPADDAIVSAFASVGVANGVVQRARLALTGVSAEGVYLAGAANDLIDGALNEERIRHVADAVEQQVTPEGDFLGSAEYRRAMAGVLARRALEECLRKEAA